MMHSSRLTWSVAEWLAVTLGFGLVTVAVTWPQPAVMTTLTHGHHDALFSMWRLSWIAEALGSSAPLFDAPIFTPARGTLAFSDAVLIQGLVAWPMLAAGVPVLPVYNIVLLLGPWMSAVAAYLLVRSLTGSRGAGVVAGMVFGFLPYRMEHSMHLELQWSQWMPLTLWALHRTWMHGRVADGMWTGLFILLQFLSCIYYGVFLVLFLVLIVPLLFWAHRPPDIRRTMVALAVGAVVIAPPLLVYAAPYREAQAALGPRAADEIARWSATWWSYLSTPRENRLYGELTWMLGSGEGRAFPGIAATVLALIALVRPARIALVYLWGLCCAVVLSLGSNTPLYGVVLALVPPLAGLRAPGRFSMIVALALSVLAGLGMARLLSRVSRHRLQAAAAALACVVLVAEYASDFGPLYPWTSRAPAFVHWLRGQPPGGVLHLPAPTASELPTYDAEWSYLGTFHWRPLANGYSGYYPRQYIDLLHQLLRFPSDESLRALRARDITYILLHEDRFEGADLLELLGQLQRIPDVRSLGRIPDRRYPVTIYELLPPADQGGER